METSLHRQLKQIYAGEAAQVEVRLAGYRIDAVADGELVEIQHGSLAAIRDKISRLLEKHRVRIVKPIVASKVLVRCESPAADLHAARVPSAGRCGTCSTNWCISPAYSRTGG